MRLEQHDTLRMNRVLRHRLRNLASGMRSALMLLAQELDARLTDAEREYFPLLRNECDELQRITDRLHLLFDEAPPGGPACLQDTLAAAAERVRRDYPAVQVALEPAGECLAQTLPHGGWDGIILEEILRNAAQAHGAPKIVVSGAQRAGGLCLVVSDDGPGIAAENHALVFRPFFTTRARHLGVGLTLARRWAERQGASVSLADAAGGGAVFEVCWPVAKAGEMSRDMHERGDAVTGE